MLLPKVSISTLSGAVMGRYTALMILRTPHRVGWAVQTIAGEWLEVDG